jgi:hypothetical protein
MRVLIISLLPLVACGRQEEAVSKQPLMPVEHVSVSIDRAPADVYAFAADPSNLPRWAKGLAEGPIEVRGATLLVKSPMGEVGVRFVDRNAQLVLDHDVTLPSGEVVHNPMRVLPNAKGSEVVFSVFRRPGVDDEEFRSDTRAVDRDLKALKALLEAR